VKVQRPFAFKILGVKTIVYVDGFNLYYCALRNSKHKWLNLLALCGAALPKTCDIAALKYYKARVSARRNPSSPKDQNSYLTALATLPNVQVYFGRFQVTDKSMFLVQPMEFLPPGPTPYPTPEFVRVVKTEEKGSDVNLGVHLVRDALKGAFEHAAIVTNDTDLREPLRIVVEEAKLPVTLLTPVVHPSSDLQKLATHIRHLGPYLGVSQFPDPVIAPDGKSIPKPIDW
jgi:uncharacterized LabA/DUF88 family protein